MVNKLKPEKKATLIRALVEGSSIRSTERMTGVHRDTITRLLLDVGGAFGEQLDKLMRSLSCQWIEVDEVWCYGGKKQRHVSESDDNSEVGDFYTWVAMDADTKLIPSFQVGKRDSVHANAFVSDLASRLENRIQISSDGLRTYIEAVEARFGTEVDYAQIVKAYEAESIVPGRSSPPKVTSAERYPIMGRPNMDLVPLHTWQRYNEDVDATFCPSHECFQ